MAVTDQPLAPDTILHDRYKVQSVLGQGGMSRVYLAMDQVLEVPVAIKENLQADPTSHAQFKQEAEFLARLSHPNLPRVTDFFVTPETSREYLVMDYIEGDDLAAVVAREGSLSQERAVGYITQVLDALDYLHSRQPPIIHRDIKPSNIKLTPEGKAMLVDFGIAKAYEATALTLTGARAVTPGFAPPEQYGMRTDARSDIYATGATLFTLLTGQIPPESTLRVANVVTMPELHSLAPKVSPQVDAAILKAMEPDTTKRWANAKEFRSALINAPPPPILTETVPVKAVPAAAAVGTAAPRPGTVPEPIARTVVMSGGGAWSAAPKTNSNLPILLGGAVVAVLLIGGILLFMSGALGGARPTPDAAGGVAGGAGSPTSVSTSAPSPNSPTQVAAVVPSEATATTEAKSGASPQPTATEAVATTVATNLPTQPADVATEAGTATGVPTATEAAATDLPAPTSTLSSPTAKPEATAAVPAQVAVSAVRLDPPEQHRGTNVRFFVSFQNSFDSAQQHSWSIWIFQADNLRKTFWQSRTVNSDVATGTSELATLETDPWCICGAGGPQSYVLRVRDLTTGTYFNGTDGQPYALNFEVVP